MGLPLIAAVLVLGVSCYALVSCSILRLARRTGVSNAGQSWVPILQFAVLCRIAGKSPWLTLFFFVPLVNIVFACYLGISVARRLGRSPWLGLLFLLPPALPIVLAIFAFDDVPWVAQYTKTLGAAAISAVLILIGAFAATIMGVMTSSPAYQLGLARAQNSPALIEKLGSPVRPGWYVTGQINTSGSAGTARLMIPVSGPKGSARVLVLAERSGGQWKLGALAAKLTGTGQLLDLSAASQAPAPSPIPAPTAAATPAPPAQATRGAASPAAAPAAAAGDEAAKPAKPFDRERILSACSNEIGLLCGASGSNARTAIRCLREHEDDLLPGCRSALNPTADR